MSHHSDHPLIGLDFEGSPMGVLKRRMLDTASFTGATGLFPGGQMGPNDEGQILFRIEVIDGRIVVDFGKPVHSLGMTPQEACDLAGHLVKVARAAARRRGESVALTIA